MPMYFGFPVNNTYLFQKFSSSTTAEYLLWLLGIAIFSGAVQYINNQRNQYQNKEVGDLLRQQLALQSNRESSET